MILRCLIAILPLAPGSLRGLARLLLRYGLSQGKHQTVRIGEERSVVEDVQNLDIARAEVSQRLEISRFEGFGFECQLRADIDHRPFDGREIGSQAIVQEALGQRPVAKVVTSLVAILQQCDECIGRTLPVVVFVDRRSKLDIVRKLHEPLSVFIHAPYESPVSQNHEISTAAGARVAPLSSLRSGQEA